MPWPHREQILRLEVVAAQFGYWFPLWSGPHPGKIDMAVCMNTPDSPEHFLRNTRESDLTQGAVESTLN